MDIFKYSVFNNPLTITAAVYHSWGAFWDYFRNRRLDANCVGIHTTKSKVKYDVSLSEVYLFAGGGGKVIHYVRGELYYEFNPQIIKVMDLRLCADE